MTTTSPNLGLTLYSGTTDASALFLLFRTEITGSATTSNMYKIDTFAGKVSGSITDLQSVRPVYYVNATLSSPNNYVATVPTLTAYVNNIIIDLTLDTTITASTSLSINALGNKTLQKMVNGSLTNLSSGDLKAGKDYLFRYNGTSWTLMGNAIMEGISSSGSSGNIVFISGSTLADSGYGFNGLSGVPTLISGSISPCMIPQHDSSTTKYGVGSSGSYGHVKSGCGIVSNNGILSVSLGTGSGIIFNSSSALSLSPTGITAGSYNKVQVDSFGRITSGSIQNAGHVIQFSGSNLPQQPNLKFSGNGVTVTNNVSASSTDVTLSNNDSVIIPVTYGENIIAPAYVYYEDTDGLWYKVDTDESSIACGYPRGIAISDGIPVSSGSVTLLGKVSGFTGLTAGNAVYASTVSGCVTSIKPTAISGGGQQAIIMVGVADSSTSLVLENYSPVRFVKRENLNSGNTLTIDHYPDLPEQSRDIRAYISTTTTTNSITTNGSSNYNTDYTLQGLSTTGSTVISYSGSKNIPALGDTADSDTDLGETFRVGTDGKLSQIKTLFTAVSGTPSGCVVWSIFEATLSAGSYIPSGSAFPLQSGSFTPISGAGSGVINTINVTNGIPLDSTKYYAITFVTSARQTTNNRWNMADSFGETDSKPYKQGNMIRSTNRATWVALARNLNMTVVTEGTSTSSEIGQSFSVSSPAILDKMDLWLKRTGSPTGSLSVTLEYDNGGSPSGSILIDTGVISASSINTTYGWQSFNPTSSCTINASTNYWVVLNTSASSADSSNYISLGASSPSTYADGNLITYSSGSWSNKTDDAIFNVFESGTSYDEPLTIDSWSIGSGTILSRYDNGSGSFADTKTTFKNNYVAAIDVTCEVHLP